MLMPDPVRYARMTTAERRAGFLLEHLFRPGTLDLAYVDLDRTVIGSAVPLGAPFKLKATPELRAVYLPRAPRSGRTERRRPGIGTSRWSHLPLDKLVCLYIGPGANQVNFLSADAELPAAFYLLSYPAHKTIPPPWSGSPIWKASNSAPPRPATNAPSTKQSTATVAGERGVEVVG